MDYTPGNTRVAGNMLTVKLTVTPSLLSSLIGPDGRFLKSTENTFENLINKSRVNIGKPFYLTESDEIDNGFYLTTRVAGDKGNSYSVYVEIDGDHVTISVYFTKRTGSFTDEDKAEFNENIKAIGSIVSKLKLGSVYQNTAAKQQFTRTERSRKLPKELVRGILKYAGKRRKATKRKFKHRKQ